MTLEITEDMWESRKLAGVYHLVGGGLKLMEADKMGTG